MEDENSQNALFQHLVATRQRISRLMTMQLTAALIILVTVMAGSNGLERLRLEIDFLREISQSKSNLVNSWIYDRVILSRGSEEFYDESFMEEFHLLTIVLQFLLMENEENRQVQTSEMDEFLSETGNAVQTINYYNQALATLILASPKPLTELRDFELEAYFNYLRMEELVYESDFRSVITKVFRAAAMYQVIFEKNAENNPKPVDSIGILTDRVTESESVFERVHTRLQSGASLLGDEYPSPPIFELTDSDLISNFVTSELIEDPVTIKSFRGFYISSIYQFTDQMASSEDAQKLTEFLERSDYSTLQDVESRLKTAENELEELEQNQQIPILFLGVAVSLSDINWFLPIANFVFLILILNLVRRESVDNALLGEKHRLLLEQISPYESEVNNLFTGPISWKLTLNTISLFGLILSLIVIQLTNNGLSLIQIFAYTVCAWLLLVTPTIWLWRKSQKG